LAGCTACLSGGAVRELRRRGAGAWISGRELYDLARQSADDAMLTILGKLDSFRGESLFTTWAYPFVVLEMSGKLGRHYWRQHPAEAPCGGRLGAAAGPTGAGPGKDAEHTELVKAVRRAVEETLTEHQRRLFVAVVLNEAPRTRWRPAWARTGTPSTRRSSTPAVRSAGSWSLTDTWRREGRDRHEQLGSP
jgi:hypothetical protein